MTFHKEIMKPLGSIVPNNPAQTENVKRLMMGELISLTTFFGFTNRKQADEYAEMFLSSNYTANQVAGLCRDARTIFTKMPAFREMVNSKQREVGSDKDFIRGKNETQIRIKKLAAFKLEMGTGWNNYLTAFRRLLIMQCPGIKDIEGIDIGYWSEHYAFDLLTRSGMKSGRALEKLREEL